MEKISVSDGRSLLKTAAATIRVQEQEIKDLREKVASYERGTRIDKIAKEMQQKGLNEDLDFEEKVAMLKQKNLDTMEEAVKIASPQGRLIGDLSDEQLGSGNSRDAFVTFINTGDGPSD